MKFITEMTIYMNDIYPSPESNILKYYVSLRLEEYSSGRYSYRYIHDIGYSENSGLGITAPTYTHMNEY